MPSLITKRGTERYRASVTIQGITRQKLFPDASKKSYKDALIWENETKKELLERLSRTNSVSFKVGHWANEYLEDAQNRFAKRTFDEKRAVFKRFFKETPVQPDWPIEKITQTICRKYLSKQFKQRSGYSANKERKNLGTAWNWGHDNLEGWPKTNNPFLSVKRFPEIRQPRYVPPESDYWKVYQQAQGQDQLMLLAFLHLAARRGEIFGLKWDDVDFTADRIRLWTSKREAGSKEADWLPMTKELRNGLLAWRETQLAIAGIDKEYVFVCLDQYSFCDPYYGKPFSNRQHFMRRLCDKAKVKAFGFQAIRHLSASILYQKGYSLSVIQAILRHKNPNTTARYLRTLGLEQTREALEEGLKGPAQVIQFEQIAQKQASGNN